MGYDSDENLVKHEYGHVVHMSQIGVLNYVFKAAVPSVFSYNLNLNNPEYFSQPWEYIADVLGNVESEGRSYQPYADFLGKIYYIFTVF